MSLPWCLTGAVFALDSAQSLGLFEWYPNDRESFVQTVSECSALCNKWHNIMTLDRWLWQDLIK